jgi:hypothetical protein
MSRPFRSCIVSPPSFDWSSVPFLFLGLPDLDAGMGSSDLVQGVILYQSHNMFSERYEPSSTYFNPEVSDHRGRVCVSSSKRSTVMESPNLTIGFMFVSRGQALVS